MVSSSLRRSQRGKTTPFKEGDNVQIVKSKGVLSGVLIRKLDESKPSNPVWVVRFDDGTKDQAIQEKSFGRVVPSSRSSNSDNSTSAANSSDGDNKACSTSSSKNVGLVLPSHEGGKQKSSKKKSTKNKQKQQQRVAAVARLSGNVSNSKNGKKSIITEREQHQQEAGINTRSSAKGKRNYTSLDTIPATPKPPPKKSKKDTKEEYVKVQYSTGTLYLYRGENPRAVFKWNF